MNKLQEICEAKIQILSEKKTKDGETMSILAPWIVSDRRNKNGRSYPLSLIKREVAKVQSSIKAGSMISSADHPFGAHTTLADASHIVRKLEVDKDGKGWMEAEILPTTKGKNIITIIKAGGQLGISARGAGSVSPSGVVASDYRLLGIDFCTSPSEPEAVFNKSNVFESQNFEEEANGLVEKQILALEQESYLGACESGFKGTWQEWEAQYSNSFREMFGLPKTEGGETTVEKLTEEQVSARTYSFYQESVHGGYKEDFNTWKTAYPRLVEMAKEAKTITEKKADLKEPFKAKMSLKEAHASGFSGTVEEFKEQHPEIELIAPASPQKPIVEQTLKEEAAKIFTALSKDNPNSQLTLESVIEMLKKEEILKADKRLRKKAIAIVSRDLDGSLSQAEVEKMVEVEIENLKKKREEMRERNWQAYRKLLD